MSSTDVTGLLPETILEKKVILCKMTGINVKYICQKIQKIIIDDLNIKNLYKEHFFFTMEPEIILFDTPECRGDNLDAKDLWKYISCNIRKIILALYNRGQIWG